MVLDAIITICVNLDTLGSLSPSMLGHIGDFITYFSSNPDIYIYLHIPYRTLQKIHTFVEVQQQGNKIKILLRLSEMNTLLKDCKTGMRNAIDVFKV